MKAKVDSLFQERQEWKEREDKKGKHHGDGDKKPDPPSSSSPPSSPSSLSSPHSTSSNPFKSGYKPKIKLDVKFDLPKYCGELNAEKLDDWIQQVEVYSRVQNLLDDVDRIQLATIRLGGTTLTWWESKTKATISQQGRVNLTWAEFVNALKKQFYPLGHMQQLMMDWQMFKQGKGQTVQEYTHEFRKRAIALNVPLYSQDTLLK